MNCPDCGVGPNQQHKDFCDMKAKIITETSTLEGWTWSYNSKKWHYYRGMISLCCKRGLLAHPSEGYELGNNERPDNCKVCRTKLEKEIKDVK